jgi:hypothetical protein
MFRLLAWRVAINTRVGARTKNIEFEIYICGSTNRLGQSLSIPGIKTGFRPERAESLELGDLVVLGAEVTLWRDAENRAIARTSIV